MLWFRKDSGSSKRRRRRSSQSSGSGKATRPSRPERGTASRRPTARRLRRVGIDGKSERRREDTRDRDARRRQTSRDRVVEQEQEKVFAALSFDDEAAQTDLIESRFGRSLTTVTYALLGILVLAALTYAVERGVAAFHAGRVEPLIEAAAEGRLDVIRGLVSRGAPINGIGPDGGTPLGAAIRAGQLEAARALLEGGALPSDDAVRLAMRYERWEILAALIEAGGNPDVRGEWDGKSPLELATERNDIAMIRLLLEHGADPDEVSHEGPLAQPALHFAAEHNMQDVVTLLLEHGADPRKLWMGYLPRHLAENAGHTRLAGELARAEQARRRPDAP